MTKFNFFVIVLLHCLRYGSLNYTENQYISNNEGFLFSIPRVLVSGQNHTACISLHNILVPVRCDIEIKQRDRHFPIITTIESDNTCFELFIPKINIQEPYLITLKVQIQNNGLVYSAHNLDPILVYPNKWTKTFIDTDKGFYRPGDKIKFRILVVDEKLLPVNVKISKVSINNPLEVTVAVWEDVNLENGIVSLEYEMVEESLVGNWKIECMGESVQFEVSKYVLPRFQVNLIYPKKMYYKMDTFSIVVCARYAYGRQVKGLAFIKITNAQNNMKPINRLKGMENGCGEFTISAEDIQLGDTTTKFISETKMSLHIAGTVTEKGTNKIEIEFGKIEVDYQPYKMKFSGESMFQPGLPYMGKLILTDVNRNISQEVVEICYNFAIKKSWNYINNEQCSNFSLNGDNELNFQVLPMTRNVIHITFHAKSLNNSNIEDSFSVVRLFSPSNNYIHLQQNIKQPTKDECRAIQEFKVTFTADYFKDNDHVIFYYVVKSGSQIYNLNKITHKVKKSIPSYFDEFRNIVGEKHKYSKLGTYVDSLVIRFELNRRIVSTYQLLVYYVNNNGETIAESRTVNVEPCLMQVSANWNQDQMVPGATAELNIKTTSQSVCSVSAIDKSTTFFGLKYQKPKLISVLRTFYPNERGFLNTTRKTCVVRERQHRNTPKIWNSSRRIARHVYSFSEDYDAFDIFNNFGSIVITNLKVVTKSCYQGPLLTNTVGVQFLTQQYEDENEQQVTSIRSHFPETWLWELVPLNGAVQLRRHLPHSITSYLTNILCVSETEGVGISEEMEIISFQNIFVEVLTPYSVKREEIFYVYIHVSNYKKHSLPIRLNFLMSAGLEVQDKETKLSTSYCIAGNDTHSHKVKLKAVNLGAENISVLVETDNQYPLYCGPDTIVFKRDSEIRTILVEAEGFRMKKTKSALLCASDSSIVNNNISWYISVPASIVPDTYKGHISLNGDVLGKTIDNLEQLLDMPTGCGEQIMATMAPNLYVLRYLNSTNSLKRTMKLKILRNLKIGYQRILNYVHEDGSFSAFGYHDPMGSTFLTTFVVKILSQAKQHIYIDQHVINKAVNWIFDKQLENGCFNRMQHVFQDMGGVSKENSTASLTSYVIISLSEANINIPEKVKVNSVFCIRSQVNPDKYSLALNCYTMFRLNWYSEANKLLKRLLAVSEQQQNMLWWRNREVNASSASDVEMTSYALMSLLHQNTSEHWAYALGTVRWLSSKYGSTGSFISTQDTVVALDVLSRYLHSVESRNLNLLIQMDTPEGKHNLTLTNTDSLKSRRVSMKENNGTVSVKINGNGCLLVQVIQSFNLKIIPRNKAFKFAMEVSPVSTISKCAITSLSPCLAYTAPNGPSNMAVMEISLPSGYQADRSSLYRLIEYNNTSKIEMFEEKEDKVNLYFTKLDNHMVCFTFNINENFLVEERKNALVKVYDYYNPEFQVQQFYNISEDCKNADDTEFPEIIETDAAMKSISDSEEKSIAEEFTTTDTVRH